MRTETATDLARRAGSSEAIPSQFRVPRPRVEQVINLSAPLLFFFSTSRSFPLHLVHILASFLVHRYYHSCPGHFIPPSSTSPFVLSSSPSSLSLLPDSVSLPPSSFPPSPSFLLQADFLLPQSAPSFLLPFRYRTHSHKGHGSPPSFTRPLSLPASMDSLVHDGSFDAQYRHLAVDPLGSSLQSSESIPSFPSVGPPLSDTALPTHPVSAFPDTINPAASLSVPAEVTLSDHRQMDISPTEVHQATVHHDAVSAPASITTFQSQLRESFLNEKAFDVPRPSQSSPAATSVSSFASHTSSPAIPVLNPATYGTIPPSSIASAMDSMCLPGRSRSGSAASPGRFVGSGSDLTFPSVPSSGTPTSNQGSGYRLQPSEYDVSPPTEEEGGPDLGGPHMMVVDDVLKTYVLGILAVFHPSLKLDV